MKKNINIDSFGEILNERPKGMSFEDYKVKRKEQTLRMKGFWNNASGVRQYVMGRLDGILIPSHTNSRDFNVVING